jgi:predicted unusual protein kinase regulating ubiquinone biosynthesis (AarF/ABC1/UbiB family)
MAKNRVRRAFADEDQAKELDQAAKLRLAKLLTEQTGKLKGLAMKMGQMLSYMDTSLPEPARKILATLQDSTEPMHKKAVHELFVAEMGQSPHQLFASWDDTPISAASIGQVHRAVTKDGRELAIKVQYPEIRQAMDADFKSLGALSKAVDLLLPGGASHIIEELKERLKEECDYRQELVNMEHFRKLFGLMPGDKIPASVPELSTGRILATEFVHGQKFADFVRTASPSRRNLAGETIYRIVYTGIWQHRCFNGDPHPGNYLFTADDVVLLDFGCVKYWTPEFIEGQRRIVQSALAGDVAAFARHNIEEGIFADVEDLDPLPFFQVLTTLAMPFQDDREFHFDQGFINAINERMREAANLRIMRLPKDLTFANRVWWGLFSVLSALDAKFNAHQIVKPLLYVDPADFPRRT